MSRIWSTDSLLNAIRVAESTGHAIVNFESVREANLFRNAFYNFRLRRAVGKNLTLTRVDFAIHITTTTTKSPIVEQA